MNLNTVTQFKQPLSVDEVSECAMATRGLPWHMAVLDPAGRDAHADRFAEPAVPALTASATDSRSLQPARWRAYVIQAPAAWRAAPLFKMCCGLLLASFKIWNAATVVATSACRCRQAR
ncbi:MAG: hypothetical protein WDN31_19100 [Hyphomicrobium sp.]